MWLFLVIERWKQIRRRIEKIKWTDRVSNEEVLQRVGEKRHLINHIRERQSKWIGHVMRGDTLLKDIFLFFIVPFLFFSTGQLLVHVMPCCTIHYAS